MRTLPVSVIEALGGYFADTMPLLSEGPTEIITEDGSTVIIDDYRQHVAPLLSEDSTEIITEDGSTVIIDVYIQHEAPLLSEGPTEIITHTEIIAHDANYLVYLVDFEFTTPRYYTNADIDIYHENKKYEARGMDFGGAEYTISPQVDKVNLDIDNADNSITQIVMTSEVRAKRFLLRLAVLDRNAKVIGTIIHFDGLVDSASIKKKRAKINIYNHMILWKKKLPKRMHQATCSWVFKDATTCKYAGIFNTCDKSWEQCTERGNTINFGGFRWLPDLTDRQVWWGSVPR